MQNFFLARNEWAEQAGAVLPIPQTQTSRDASIPPPEVPFLLLKRREFKNHAHKLFTQTGYVVVVERAAMEIGISRSREYFPRLFFFSKRLLLQRPSRIGTTRSQISFPTRSQGKSPCCPKKGLPAHSFLPLFVRKILPYFSCQFPL